jgi:uncharacterized membrane protein YhaH (DUF805 family)
MSTPYTSGPVSAAPRDYLHGGPVTFSSALGLAARHAFDYRGRASLSALWWFALWAWIINITASIVAGIVGGVAHSPVVVLVVAGVVGLAVGLAGLSLEVRRLHDTGRSGWWLMLDFVPVVGPLVVLVFICSPAVPYPGRYG